MCLFKFILKFILKFQILHCIITTNCTFVHVPKCFQILPHSRNSSTPHSLPPEQQFICRVSNRDFQQILRKCVLRMTARARTRTARVTSPMIGLNFLACYVTWCGSTFAGHGDVARADSTRVNAHSSDGDVFVLSWWAGGKNEITDRATRV